MVVGRELASTVDRDDREMDGSVGWMAITTLKFIKSNIRKFFGVPDKQTKISIPMQVFEYKIAD